MRIFILVLLFPMLCFSQQEKITRILFILDASNSMNSTWDKQTRLEGAKEVLLQAMEKFKGVPNIEIALRIYGHQTPITNNTQDCNDTKLEVPFSNGNIDLIKNKIRGLIAKGATPIARSLEAAAGDFPDTTSRNVIILSTDGLESCDNNPCVIAKKLREKGVKVTPFVIGLGMDLSYLENFACIGSYSDAEDKGSFSSVLTTIIEKILKNTTVQINLNDILKKPTETNVTLFLYEAGTQNLKYSYTHTLNRYNNPDTLVIDPSFKYDLIVNTLPKIEKKGISLVRNSHNIIQVDAPQGFLKCSGTTSLNATITFERIVSTAYISNAALLTLSNTNVYVSSGAPTVIESIRLVNTGNANVATTMYWANATGSPKAYFVYTLIIPTNCVVEICENVKRLDANDRLVAYTSFANTIAAFVSGRVIS